MLRIKEKIYIAILLLCGIFSAAAWDGFGTVSADLLNVRGTPERHGAVVFQLRRGDAVTVVGQRGDFYEILLPEKAPVYVADMFIWKGRTSQKANLRAAASMDSFVYTTIPAGTPVETLRVLRGDWLLIKPPVRITCFVSRHYIVQKPAPAQHPLPHKIHPPVKPDAPVPHGLKPAMHPEKPIPPKQEVKPQPKPEVKPEVKPSPPKPEVKSEVKPIPPKPEVKPQPKPEAPKKTAPARKSVEQEMAIRHKALPLASQELEVKGVLRDVEESEKGDFHARLQRDPAKPSDSDPYIYRTGGELPAKDGKSISLKGKIYSRDGKKAPIMVVR